MAYHFDPHIAVAMFLRQNNRQIRKATSVLPSYSRYQNRCIGAIARQPSVCRSTWGDCECRQHDSQRMPHTATHSWVASYSHPPSGQWPFWQYDDGVNVGTPGLGNADRSFFHRGTAEELRQFWPTQTPAALTE